MELALAIGGEIAVRSAINHNHSVLLRTSNLCAVRVTIGSAAIGKEVLIVVELIERESVLGVHALPGVGIELIAVHTLNNLLGTIDDTIAVLLGQLHHLVLLEGDASTYVHAPVLRLVNVHIARNLDTVV